MRLDKAFANVPRPGDEPLASSSRPEECEDTEPFRGKIWQELGLNFLERHRNALFWFTPQAFCYYLPAFLNEGLVVPYPDYVVSILNLLSPTENGQAWRFREERWRRLTPPQIEHCEEWLTALLVQAKPGGVFEEEVNRALQAVKDRYWWDKA
jgi:hypothetical protein